MKRVLLVTDGLFHPSLMARKTLQKVLAKIDSLTFQHTRSLEKLPEDIEGFSAVVIYIHHDKISRGALAKLDRFVSNGGGVLGIHTATASFKDEAGYHRILGGRFVGHGKLEPFAVTPVSGSDVFPDIPAFTVKDELYMHELQPGTQAHFTAKHKGQDVPVVWTYRYGQGRVCYTVPGHRAAALRSKTYQQVLQQGLLWAVGE